MEQENVIYRKPRKGVHVLISFSVYAGLYFFLSMVLSLVAYFGLGLSGIPGSYTLPQFAVLQTISLLAGVLPALLVLKYCDYRPFSDLGLNIRGRWKDFLYGLLVAILLYGIGFGLSLALGEVRIMGAHLNFTNLAGSFGVCILVAFAEEIMIRGYVLGRLLRTRLNKFLSLLISSVLFSLMHFFNPNVAFLPMLNLVLAGCLLGVAFLYTRNLWFPISLHLFWNWLQGPVLGYKVSGIELCPPLLQLQLPENTILNGGTFGFEGSIICTILMIVLTGGIIWYFEKRKRT